VVVVEFSEFECPFCGKFARESLAKLDQEFVETGKARLVFRHFPLDTIHHRARPAALTAVCADIQGRFWQVHDRFFALPQGLEDSDLITQSTSAGADGRKLSKCASGAAAEAIVDRDVAAGKALGVKSTPTFFIGSLEPDGRVRVREVIEGAQPYAVFTRAIVATMAKVGP